MLLTFSPTLFSTLFSTHSDADDIHDSLFLIDDIGLAVQFWSLIAAGILFVIILAMLYRGYLDKTARGEPIWHAFDPTSSYKDKRRNSRGDGELLCVELYR